MPRVLASIPFSGAVVTSSTCLPPVPGACVCVRWGRRIHKLSLAVGVHLIGGMRSAAGCVLRGILG